MKKEEVRMAKEKRLNGGNVRNPKREMTIDERDAAVGRIDIHFDRVAVWTLIFTNTFFVTYFFVKLLHWM